MNRVARLTGIWRYPAKSMMGDPYTSLPVDDGGVLGDRNWAVRDDIRGGIRGAKKIGGLMRLHARYLDEPRPGTPPTPIEITNPEGERVRSDDAHVNERLSKFLDHPVTLCPLRPATDLQHYRRGAPDHPDVEAELRTMFGREPEEPLPSFQGFPVDILAEYESIPGTYFDALAIHLLTDRSIATLARLAPDSDVDVRRFRPNLVVSVETNLDGDFPEQRWLGQHLRIGDVELEVALPSPRCVMVTRDFADLKHDRGILRTIVRDADQNLGVYANVTVPGTLEAGAEILLL